MKNNFLINYKGEQVQVEKQAVAGKAEEKYILHLQDGDIILQLKHDNEGANHWLDARTDTATNVSKEAGAEIESYLLKRKSSL